MAQLGDVVTAYIVKARWAYSELNSPRFGKNYVGKGPRHLFDAQATGEPFEKLTPSDHEELVKLLNEGRNSDFARFADLSPKYRLAVRTREEVAMLWALPTFGPPPHEQGIPFMDFFLETFGVGSVTADMDPRRSDRPFDPDHEPGIVVPADGRYYLLEGYGRAVAFMRSSDKAHRLRAWVPEP